MQRNYQPSADEAQQLHTLAIEVDRAAAAERAVAAQVAALRARDVPWRAIAGRLGVSPQAAQQRYGRE